ncbi:MAG: LLM class flavin-dependent oxidoreductase, partial [Gaiellaceae bacterium]
KLLVRPHRERIPIYLAALSPKNVRTAFDIADGWPPIFFSPERARDAFGYERKANEIQELYLGGRHRDAAAAVPDEFVDRVALVGPKERIAERLEAYRAAGVTTLLCGTPQPQALRVLAEIAG